MFGILLCIFCNSSFDKYTKIFTEGFPHFSPKDFWQYERYKKGQDIRFTSLPKILNALDITLEDFFKEGFDNNAE